MHGRTLCNKTTMYEPGDFETILADLSRQVFGIEESRVYVVHKEPMSDAIRHFSASVHIYGESPSLECTYHLSGRAATNEAQARQLAARQAIVQLRHFSPWMNSRPFCYYPSREGYGSQTQVASEDFELDPALVLIVHYLKVREALIDQITSEFVMNRTPTARRTTASHEAATASSNQPILVGRPIGSLSAPTSKKPKLGDLQEEVEGLWAQLKSAEAALLAARQGEAEAKVELASLQQQVQEATDAVQAA
ncbi:hypothetical protein D1007_32344 [Hordeum vulgare]|nr:hypothetical protein D1007_32344 [Hordeum vulgare]